MNKLLLLPLTLPLAIARGATAGALRAVADVVEDLATPEPASPYADAPFSYEPRRAEPVMPVEPEPVVATPRPHAVPEPDLESVPEPVPSPEPEPLPDVVEDLDLPAPEPTRGDAARLRQEQREAATTPESPGPEIRVDEPWDGYRAMTAPDVIDRLRVADDATKAVVRLFESTHRKRKTIIAATAG
jgi:hypothetical protein